MKQIILVLLIFSFLSGGFIVQTEIGGLDTSGWNFTGAELLSPFIPYTGGLIMLIGIAFILLIALSRKEG